VHTSSKCKHSPDFSNSCEQPGSKLGSFEKGIRIELGNNFLAEYLRLAPGAKKVSIPEVRITIFMSSNEILFCGGNLSWPKILPFFFFQLCTDTV
jgi:hypothetical protein